MDPIPNSTPRAARPRRPSYAATVGLSLAGAACLSLLACGPARAPEDADPAPTPRPERAEARPGGVDAGTPLGPDARRWVSETLSSLSLREKAAQLVFPWMTGGYLSTAEARFDSVAALVEEGIGGVSISVGTPLAYAARLNALQERARVPLLVTSDFESGGPGMRLGGAYALPYVISLGGGTRFPPTMAFGAIEDVRLTYELGRVTGREARAVGVHMTFAPVADVNSDPSNPVINTRSFGEDAREVADRVEAFVRGASEAGLLTVAKHFPGHGDTEVDSHIGLPVLDADWARLDTLELVPFRRAVAAGVNGIMTAHVALPKVLESDSLPSTFSPFVNSELLRRRMGFGGLVVTDALTMGAIVNRYGAREAPVLALEAGADLLLYPREPREAIDAVAEAVREGRIVEARLDGSVRRILEAKARVGLHRSRRVELERVTEVVGREEHRALAETAAARAVTLPRDRRGLVPLEAARHRRVVSVTLARPENLPAGRAFDALLARELGTVASVRVDSTTTPERYAEVAERARRADLVLLSVYLPPRSGSGSIAAPAPFLDFARGLLERDETPAVLLSFGNPYLLRSLPGAGTYLLAWGPDEGSQEAAARALLGRAPITGRLPVSVPPAHGRGEGLRRAVGRR